MAERRTRVIAPSRDRVTLVRWASAAVALLCLVQLAWWWRHPAVFPEGGSTVSAPTRVGRPVSVGMLLPRGAPRSAQVRLLAVHPVLVANTAAARVTVSVCTVPAGASPVGAVRGDLRHFCRAVRPAVDAVVDLDGRPLRQVVMTITPTRRGLVRVQGMELSYRDRWQTGTQTVGGRVSVRAR